MTRQLLNNNMRCFEIVMESAVCDRIYPLNNNMRCFEIREAAEDQRPG